MAPITRSASAQTPPRRSRGLQNIQPTNSTSFSTTRRSPIVDRPLANGCKHSRKLPLSVKGKVKTKHIDLYSALFRITLQVLYSHFSRIPKLCGRLKKFKATRQKIKVDKPEQTSVFTQPIHSPASNLPVFDTTRGRRITVVHEGDTSPWPFADRMTYTYEKYLPEAKALVWTSGQEDINTASYEKFADHCAAFSIGTSEQVGCTSMFVISRRGVYAAHWWENISFEPDPEFFERKRGRRGSLETADEVFERTVLKPLRTGACRRGELTHHELSTDIDDEFVRGYLIHPRDSCQDVEDGYRDKWDAIMDVVGDIIPRLKDKSRWEEVIYRPRDLGHEDLTKNNGRILFRYHPHLGEDVNVRSTKLWVEGRLRPYHEDYW